MDRLSPKLNRGLGTVRQRIKPCCTRVWLHVPLQVSALVALFVSVTGRTPRFRIDGGGPAENLALQNIQVAGRAEQACQDVYVGGRHHGWQRSSSMRVCMQARLRMVIAFMLAQLLPWVRGRTGKHPHMS